MLCTLPSEDKPCMSSEASTSPAGRTTSFVYGVITGLCIAILILIGLVLFSELLKGTKPDPPKKVDTKLPVDRVAST
ncbi:unnamed protein product [Dicrocoelium dendriticum]|nr:unnamed protein product [Dicrocoelium dendriticum]